MRLPLLIVVVAPVLMTLWVGAVFLLYEALCEHVARRWQVQWAYGAAVAATMGAAVLVILPALVLRRALPPTFWREALRRACRRLVIELSAVSESVHLLRLRSSAIRKPCFRIQAVAPCSSSIPGFGTAFPLESLMHASRFNDEDPADVEVAISLGKGSEGIAIAAAKSVPLALACALSQFLTRVVPVFTTSAVEHGEGFVCDVDDVVVSVDGSISAGRWASFERKSLFCHQRRPQPCIELGDV